MNRYSTLKTKTPLRARKAWNPTKKPMKRGSGFKSTGSSLKTRTTLKATKPMNKVGKVGKANIAANKRIAEITKKEDLTRCEICALHLPELAGVQCTESFTLANAHRHKRSHYKGDPEALSDRRQWVKACVGAHDAIEHDAALTEKVFGILRGPE